MIHKIIKYTLHILNTIFAFSLLFLILFMFAIIAYPYYKVKHCFRLIFFKNKEFSVFFDDNAIFGSSYIIERNYNYSYGAWKFTGTYTKCVEFSKNYEHMFYNRLKKQEVIQNQKYDINSFFHDTNFDDYLDHNEFSTEQEYNKH